MHRPTGPPATRTASSICPRSASHRPTPNPKLGRRAACTIAWCRSDRCCASRVGIDDVDDVDRGETHNAAYALWRANHIDQLDAAGVIKGALAAVHAAEERLDNAVLSARQAGLSWARIGDASMSAQAAHERWASRVRGIAAQ